jgi:UDP-3-O-acyl-N-acetylglucosamine deacetylase
MGDFALVGAPLKAKVIGYKTGHGINTQLAKIIKENAKNN